MLLSWVACYTTNLWKTSHPDCDSNLVPALLEHCVLLTSRLMYFMKELLSLSKLYAGRGKNLTGWLGHNFGLNQWFQSPRKVHYYIGGALAQKTEIAGSVHGCAQVYTYFAERTDSPWTKTCHNSGGMAGQLLCLAIVTYRLHGIIAGERGEDCLRELACIVLFKVQRCEQWRKEHEAAVDYVRTRLECQECSRPMFCVWNNCLS